MVDCSSSSTETQVLHFHSPSPPPELGWEKKSVIDQLFEDTVPLDDAVTLDDSFDGTPLVSTDFDTQIVHDSDIGEDFRQITEYDDVNDVVLDSEDEGSFDGKIHVNVIGFPGTRLDNFTEAFHGSVAGIKGTYGSKDEGKNHLRMLADDQVFTGLKYIGSQEPRESSQENALDFVDQYLSLTNLDSSPGIKPRNAVRKKVSHVSRIKGCQSLAKKIKTRTPVQKDGPFEWVDREDSRGTDFFSKRTGAKVGLGGSPQRSVIRYMDGNETSISDSKWTKKCIDLNKEVTTSPCSDSVAAADSPKEISRFEQASNINFDKKSVKNSKELVQEVQPVPQSDAYGISSTKENTSDTFDVGFSTQMAAEAMEALSYGLLSTDCCAGDVSQCTKLLDSSSVVMKSKVHLRKPCVLKVNQEGTVQMSKKRESASSSSRKHSSYHQELDNELVIPMKRKRSKSLFGGSNGVKATYQNECSARKFAMLVKKRKEGSAMCKKITKDCQNCGCLSIPHENALLGKQGKLDQSIADQIGVLAQGKLEGEKDESHNLWGKMKSVQGIIVTYKRKRSSMGAKPSEVMNAGGKCTKEEPFAHQKHRMTGSGCELEGTKDGLDIPVPGERMNAVNRRSMITYERRSAKLSEVMSSEGKSSKLCSSTSEVLRNHKLTPHKQGSLDVSSLNNSFEFRSWSIPKGKRTPRGRSCHSKGANNLSTQLMMIEGKEDYRKPYNKILPKSSLLKELIRLGIPEPKPDFTWKGLRKRRDTSHVQVLFSQHLDDDIIKQQKKVMTRLGISLASCSVDATHFIADKFVRTRNMLEAIALGKPVVTHLWLESCGQASCLIDEKNYTLRDARKEKEIGFSMPASLDRASQHPLLKGRRVFITPNIKPDKEIITSLVRAVHGHAIEQRQISNLKIPDDLLILSCEKDHSICLPFLDKGAMVYSSELLLNGIVIQKLEYGRHQLFTNQAKGHRCSNTR